MISGEALSLSLSGGDPTAPAHTPARNRYIRENAGVDALAADTALPPSVCHHVAKLAMSLLSDAVTVDLPLPLPPPAPLVRGREYRVRLLLLGASCAGKTCLRLRFTEGTFPPERRKSTFFDFSVAKLEVDGVDVNVQVRPPSSTTPPTHTHTMPSPYTPPPYPSRKDIRC